MYQEDNNLNENKKPSAELQQLIDQFSEQAYVFYTDWSNGVDKLRSVEGMTDQIIRTKLIATSKMSRELIDALMIKDYEMFCEVWMKESWDMVNKQ